jgi:integral membrane protein (TIGR01906 family)
MAFNSLWIYTAGFARYDAAAELGLSDAELKRAAQELISYFNNRHQEYFEINVTYDDGQTGPLYNQSEISHMKDVKWLLWIDYAAVLFSAAYILLYAGIFWFRNRSRVGWELARSACRGGVFTCGAIIFLGFLAVISFDWLFLKFHQLFFPQGNFQFSPYDNMIIMFPDGFWSDVALLVGLVSLVLGALVAGIGWMGLKYLHRCGKVLELR